MTMPYKGWASPNYAFQKRQGQVERGLAQQVQVYTQVGEATVGIPAAPGATVPTGTTSAPTTTTVVGVTRITSNDGSVTVTDPTGPTTDLSVATTPASGYASLTGAGETSSPGALTQSGPFTINAGSGGAVSSAQFGTNTPAPGSIVLGADGYVDIGAGAVSLSGNQLNMNFNPGGVRCVTIGGFQVQGGFSADGIGVAYGTSGAGAGSNPGISVEDLGTSAMFGLYVYHGNPNGVVFPGTGTGNGYLCVDTSTPGLWQYHLSSTSWVAL
jgi:hypothetical protein